MGAWNAALAQPVTLTRRAGQRWRSLDGRWHLPGTWWRRRQLWRGEAAPTCNDSHDDDPRRRLSQLRRGVGKRAAILPRTRRFLQGTTSKINAPRRGPVKASRRAPGGPAVWAKLAKLWPRVVPAVSPWRCAARQSMPSASSSLIRWSPSHAGALLLCCSAALLLCCSAALLLCLHATIFYSSNSTPNSAARCPRVPVRPDDQHPGHHSRHVLSASLTRRLSHARRL
jgi:hypothetical protein